MNRRKFLKTAGISSAVAMVSQAKADKGKPAPEMKWLGSGPGARDPKKFLRRVEQMIQAGPFSDSWESLAKYQVPEWYQDAKFGIFIHWGVYSVPAFFSEWYPREMYRKWLPVFWYHRLKYGPQDKFGYKDFIPMFKAEKFDPEGWAELFKEAGARYVVPVAEHHDGFAMYDCGFSEWTAVKMGPKRDILRELSEAVRKKGMAFGLSSHRAEHWWFMNGGREFNSDVNDPSLQAFYGPAMPEEVPPSKEFLDDWLARCAELVELYEPDLFWFDWWIEQPAFEPYRRRFAAYYYNCAKKWGKEVVLNYKNQAFPDGTAILDLERAQLTEIRPMVWQTDTSVSYLSWGYIKHDQFKTPRKLIKILVDIVSKNGNLLLNVGPKPDGTIPEEAEEILLEIGKWLAINGEAIYGTRPWKIFGEGPTKQERNTRFGLGEMAEKELTEKDIRFTVKGDTLYALVMGIPKDNKVVIKSLGRNSGLFPKEISSLRLLGHSSTQPKWNRSDQALIITLPDPKPCKYALALAIK